MVHKVCKWTALISDGRLGGRMASVGMVKKGKEDDFHFQIHFPSLSNQISLQTLDTCCCAAAWWAELQCPEQRKAFGAAVCSPFNEEVSTQCDDSDQAAAAGLFAQQWSFLLVTQPKTSNVAITRRTGEAWQDPRLSPVTVQMVEATVRKVSWGRAFYLAGLATSNWGVTLM